MGSACISMEPWSGRLTSHSGSHTVQSSSGSHPTLDPIPCSLRAAHIPLWIPSRAVFERLTSHSGSHPVQPSSCSHPTLDPIPCSLRAAHIPLLDPIPCSFRAARHKATLAAAGAEALTRAPPRVHQHACLCRHRRSCGGGGIAGRVHAGDAPIAAERTRAQIEDRAHQLDSNRSRASAGLELALRISWT